MKENKKDLAKPLNYNGFGNFPNFSRHFTVMV